MGRQLSLLQYVRDLPGLVESRIESFIEKYRPRWIYVEFSGGKDSTAVLAAARNVTDRIIAVYLHIAGQVVHDNVMAVLKTAEKLGLRVYRCSCKRRGYMKMFFEENDIEMPALVYAIVNDYRLGLPYWEAVRRIGWPAPAERWGAGKRWCCTHFKAEWLMERPPNGTYLGRPARFLLVGIRREESNYRAKKWSNVIEQPFYNHDGSVDVALAPVVDLSEADIWSLLRHYGLYEIVKRQYDRWGHRSPNCVLCPLMGKESLKIAVRNLPTGYLLNVLRVAQELRRRYRDGTFSAQKIDMFIEVIGEELKRRGVEP